MTATSRPLVVSVDDEPPVLRSLQRLLRGEPYEFIATDRPGDVIQWAGSRAIDLLIADHRMPGITGVELIREVRRRSPETSCLLLTAHLESAHADGADDLNVDGIFVKPWSGRELRESIGRIVGTADREIPAIRIDCERTRPEAVLARVFPVFMTARGPGRRVDVRLSGLRSLEGSIPALLLELVRLARRLGSRVRLSDDAGFARVLLDAVGGAEPFVTAARTDP